MCVRSARSRTSWLASPDAGWDAEWKKVASNIERTGSQIAPGLLEFYPAIIWEDQDECLEVRPEDVMV